MKCTGDEHSHGLWSILKNDEKSIFMLAFLRTHDIGCAIPHQLKIMNSQGSELSKAILFRQDQKS